MIQVRDGGGLEGGTVATKAPFLVRSGWILDIFGRDDGKELLWLGVRFSKDSGLEKWCPWVVWVSFLSYPRVF